MFLTLSEASKLRFFFFGGWWRGGFFGAFGNFREKRLPLGPFLHIQMGPDGFFGTRTPPSLLFWWLVQGQFYRPQSGEVVFQIRPNRLREMCKSRRCRKLGGGAGPSFFRLLSNSVSGRAGKIRLSRSGSLDVSVAK